MNALKLHCESNSPSMKNHRSHTENVYLVVTSMQWFLPETIFQGHFFVTGTLYSMYWSFLLHDVSRLFYSLRRFLISNRKEISGKLTGHRSMD